LSRKYWLDLFTGKTWEEFLKSGSNISGFRESRKKIAERIQIGDYFLCYLTGISRFNGVLEVLSQAYFDKTPIWEDEDFPVRFKVKLIHQLSPKTAIPIHEFKNSLSIFKGLKSPHAWSGFFRGSPAEFNLDDGEIILSAIKKAVEHPVERDYDEKKYWRKPRKTYISKLGKVTIPETEKEEKKEIKQIEPTSHEEIQYMLLKLGSEMGLDVWVARNDRNKEYNGKIFNEIPNIRSELPRQFDDATNRTIELIDVLWLQGEAIVAAFEVEHSTAIFSGLLRMSDLVSMQPNINLNLFLVAPDERREKVFSEINRPTFARLKPPLPEICKFIPYSKLKREIQQVESKIRFLKPEFIEVISENCKANKG
jgi:hypothetical protein